MLPKHELGKKKKAFIDFKLIFIAASRSTTPFVAKFHSQEFHTVQPKVMMSEISRQNINLAMSVVVIGDPSQLENISTAASGCVRAAPYCEENKGDIVWHLI